MDPRAFTAYWIRIRCVDPVRQLPHSVNHCTRWATDEACVDATEWSVALSLAEELRL